jgi:nuclear protein localization family protein 4
MFRIGYLYGRFNADNSVKVEVVYEPPQEASETSFTLLEDPQQERVTTLANLLGLKKVGWIFAHPPREKG